MPKMTWNDAWISSERSEEPYMYTFRTWFFFCKTSIKCQKWHKCFVNLYTENQDVISRVNSYFYKQKSIHLSSFEKNPEQYIMIPDAELVELDPIDEAMTPQALFCICSVLFRNFIYAFFCVAIYLCFRQWNNVVWFHAWRKLQN